MFTLTEPEMADCARDAIALITANQQDPNATERLALTLVKIQPGEQVTHWLARMAATLDVCAYIAVQWLGEWGTCKDVPADVLLRRFAEGFTTSNANRRGDNGNTDA